MSSVPALDATAAQTPVELGRGLPIGSGHHRAFVGAPESYDLVSAVQFNLLTFLGLREDHCLLDVGCGSLRGGRLFIPYLLPGRYFGIEPEQWLIEDGIRREVGNDLIEMKQPVFSNERDFALGTFGRSFDFILAQSIFSHASLPQIRACLSEGKRVLAPAGLFVATFVLGDEDYAGDGWVYPGCVTYTAGRISSLAEEAELACGAIDWPHPAQQTWFIFAHAENEAAIPNTADQTKLLTLENELRFAQARLKKLEGHPYVRLGQAVAGHPVTRGLRSALRRLPRAA